MANTIDPRAAALDRAIELFGTQGALARALGLGWQTSVSEMRRRALQGRDIPIHHAMAIERLTKGSVKRQQLAPTANWKLYE